jgi:hypothetical protein
MSERMLKRLYKNSLPHKGGGDAFMEKLANIISYRVAINLFSEVAAYSLARTEE